MFLPLVANKINKHTSVNPRPRSSQYDLRNLEDWPSFRDENLRFLKFGPFIDWFVGILTDEVLQSIWIWEVITYGGLKNIGEKVFEVYF
jgi:hypothetical protein